MCGRYYIKESAEMDEIIRLMNASPLKLALEKRKLGVRTYGERFPSEVVPVIAMYRRGKRAVFPMKWGYDIGKLVINARAETAAEKPLFQNDWKRHRCVIPASWYFEWEHRKGSDGKVHTLDKYLIQPRVKDITWLCGLYQIKDGLPSFVILTKEAEEEIRFIHDRMPVILPEDLVSDWIRPETRPEELIREPERAESNYVS